MGFVEDVRLWAEKTKTIRPQLQTEEAVKHALIMPFLQMLGYNVFDPTEVVPEFTSDHGIKKGEKVDYAIMRDGIPHILIEVKGLACDVTAHSSQLYRYFSVTKAKFAILTNGVCYQFFSDLDEPNKMDNKPFLIVDLENIREQAVGEMEKFHKRNYDVSLILSTATELKYANQIKEFVGKQLREPGEELSRLIIKSIYEGKITQQVSQKFDPLIKRSISTYLNELVSDKLKSALQETERQASPTPLNGETADPVDQKAQPKELVTTEEEIEAFVTIRMLLRDQIGPDHQVSYKDTASYFNVLLDGNIRKWICRLYLTPSQKAVQFRDGDKVVLGSIAELEQHREKLAGAVNGLIAD